MGGLWCYGDLAIRMNCIKKGRHLSKVICQSLGNATIEAYPHGGDLDLEVFPLKTNESTIKKEQPNNQFPVPDIHHPLRHEVMTRWCHEPVHT